MNSTLPYGAWPSPIGSELATSSEGLPDFIGAVGDEVWWTASRPAEGGRQTIVRRHPDGSCVSILPAPWNVRSRVIEYGGLPWAGIARAEGGPLVVFANYADQRLYSFEPDGGGEPRPLTPTSSIGGGLRWADPRIMADRGEIWCVLEEFTGESPTDVRRVIAAVPLDGSAAQDRGAVRELSDGAHRFVTGPEVSRDGRWAAWIGWDHPNMPWDGTEVVLAEVTGEGGFEGAEAVLGGGDEAVAQVAWEADGSLLYASDRPDDGWWRLRRADPGKLRAGSADIELLSPPVDEEFGGGPLWQLGRQWFRPLEDGTIAILHGNGSSRLGILDPASGTVTDVPGHWTEWTASLAVIGSRVVGIAGSPESSYEVVEFDTSTNLTKIVGSAHGNAVDPAYYPRSQQRTFPDSEGRPVHAYVFLPHHPEVTGPQDELPPFVMWAHGGPTSCVPNVLKMEIAYFTSRGIGVAVVNYGGSTGYGRAYRDRLRGQWGVVDVKDCEQVATALAAEGTADRARLAVRGGSAGGWTAGASLTSSDVYACGCIMFPVLDLLSFAGAGTHDFESQYIEGLVGPFDEDLYRESSPLAHADRVTAPFVVLQGLDDPVCPPAQALSFVAAIEGRGIPHAYIGFEGETHGFRQKNTKIRAIEAELSLYAQVFGFERPEIPLLELTP